MHQQLGLLEANHATRAVLHQHNLVAGLFGHVLQRRVCEPDRQRLPFAVVEVSTISTMAVRVLSPKN